MPVGVMARMLGRAACGAGLDLDFFEDTLAFAASVFVENFALLTAMVVPHVLLLWPGLHPPERAYSASKVRACLYRSWMALQQLVKVAKRVWL